MGAGLSLEGAQIAGGETMRDKIARRIANIGDAPGFGGVVAARVGGQGRGGVSQGAAGGVDSAADDHPLELLDVTRGVLTFEKGLEVPYE